MANQVDGGGGTNPAAARAAEEARRRAAEEAARRAAEEAARRAAEEAARKAAQTTRENTRDLSGARGGGRYAAYAAPEVAPPPPRPVEKPAVTAKLAPAEPVAPPPEPPKPKEGLAAILEKVKEFFGLGAPAPKPDAPAPKPAAPKPEPPKQENEAAAGTAPEVPDAVALPAAIRKEMELAREQAPGQEATRAERNAPASAEVRATNAQTPVSPEHEAVFNTLTPEQQQAFRELSGQSRESFHTVYQRVGGMWAEPTPHSQEASHGLRKMLEEQRLEVRDTTGKTLIDTLAERAGQRLNEEMKYFSPVGALQSTIKHIAYPDRVFQGENTNTCASTALQGILANEDPAEFVRVATGLVFDGHVRLQGGADLRLDASQVGNGRDGDRSALSQAIQTSLDTFAKQYPPEGDADFAGGRVGGGGRYGGGRVGGGSRYGGGRVGGGSRYGEGEAVAAAQTVGAVVGAEAGAAIGGVNGGQVDGGGLTQNQIEKLYEQVAGRLAFNISVNEENRFATLDGVASALAAGQKVPVGVQGIDNAGNTTHHMISVVEIRQNPENPGDDQVVFTDPGTGRVGSLPVKEFAQILEAAIIPAQYADHMRWNVAPNEADPFGGGRVGGGGRMG